VSDLRIVADNAFLWPGNYLDPTPRPVPLWGVGANRAHIIAVETFAPFAALVLIAHVRRQREWDDGVLPSSGSA
jgi:hypothetical protein